MTGHPGVHAFCDALGLNTVRGLPLVLAFERTGRLRMEEDGDGLVLSLERDLPAWRTGVLAAALRAVYADRGLPRPVHVRCRGRRSLLLSLRIPAVEVDTPTLDGCLRLLARLADEAEGATGAAA